MPGDMETCDAKPYTLFMQHKNKFPKSRLSLCEVAVFEDPRDSKQPRITLVEIFEFLNSASASSNRPAVKRALLAIMDNIFDNSLVRFGVVPAVVKHLRAPESTQADTEPYPHELKTICASILARLAKEPEHKKLIIDAGALSCLVDLLRRHKNINICCPLVDLLSTVADVIGNLASGNTNIMTLVRMEGGIPPLVELLEFNVTKVQKAVASALATLAYDNHDNKKQIVECNALSTLVLMLQLEDSKTHYEAGVLIENLVHSSPDIMKEVLLAGALQPVICLLSSVCRRGKEQAVRLIGIFAAKDSDCKVHIIQRGVIPQLVDLLKSSYYLGETLVVTLGSLAPESHNQVIIAHNGGIEPLLTMLDSKKAGLQHQAVLSLYGLADNELADFIEAGGFQKLRDGHFKYKSTKQCIEITLKRLEEKMQGQVLKRLIHLMCYAEKGLQIRVATALAYLCSPHDCKTIFFDNNGLELLVDTLESPSIKQKRDTSAALCKLATKVSSQLPKPQMYLGEEYVNNAKLSDVTFLVEGRSFYAHRDCLLSSDVFRAMLDGDYREREAKHIVIPNIKWGVFELMMRYIYTGRVDVNLDIAEDLWRAADQYLLDRLKSICEYAIVRNISEENVALMYKMSKDLNATSFQHACILFVLENFFRLRSNRWYCRMVHRIIPDIRYCSPLKPDETMHDLLQDVKRIDYHKAYLTALLRAIRKGADVRGYMIWSLLDNFEWANGYDIRYGLYHVNRDTLERIPKLSVQWFSSFLNNTIHTNITEHLREQQHTMLEARM